jgi:hypothetical protein
LSSKHAARTCSVSALVYFVTMKLVRLTAYAMQLLTSSHQKKLPLAATSARVLPNAVGSSSAVAGSSSSTLKLRPGGADARRGARLRQVGWASNGRPIKPLLTSLRQWCMHRLPRPL